jgi:hypothetical protein
MDNTEGIIKAIYSDMENGAPPEYFIPPLVFLSTDKNIQPYARSRFATVLRDISQETTSPCPNGRHGEQEFASMGSGSGFAGGTIYWTVFACGCTEMDESDDIEAAR